MKNKNTERKLGKEKSTSKRFIAKKEPPKKGRYTDGIFWPSILPLSKLGITFQRRKK